MTRAVSFFPVYYRDVIVFKVRSDLSIDDQIHKFNSRAHWYCLIGPHKTWNTTHIYDLGKIFVDLPANTEAFIKETLEILEDYDEEYAINTD